MAPGDTTILTVDAAAGAALVAARDELARETELALSVEVTGVDGNRYTHHLAFMPVAEAGPDDQIEHHDGLRLLIPADSVERVRGSRLRAADGGIHLDNPNTPSPPLGDPAAGAALDPDAPVVDRVQRVLEDHVNPAIAVHGGRADLIAVEGATAHVRLLGGCQGCTLAGVTLAEGIELYVRAAVPEITAVVDGTDHDSGTAPYFTG